MNEEDIKNAMYGSVKELMKSNKYFYAGIMRQEFTEEGKKVISDLINMYAPKILEAQKVTDDTRAKELVVKGLKGEQI